ncbi:hypothetical protein [Neolewinella litorea]|uniref:Uncharacterized protein n=1 Tax=Neolewinella litorea TaxID=2562452 RepID=A0A4S4NI48_9BACT|nr:hypothetical protein [Neolewinella litorea]THH39406.1 hypothetical protein E4021_11675 [Neolewinella litorea]
MSTVIDPRWQPAAAADYRALRAEAYAAVEQLARDQWTDYNAHDPGITLLEHLADALAELGYRGSFDVADLLTDAGGGIDYRQPFFTARHILTNAPVTNDDYRRLLIDSLGLSNAWVICKACACGPAPYPDCTDGELTFAPRWRLRPSQRPDEHEPAIIIRGFTDVLIQFAPDAELGNLNTDRVEGQLLLPDGSGGSVAIDAELRFPEWRDLSPAAYRLAGDPGATLTAWSIDRFSRDRTNSEPVDADDLRRGLRDIFFLDLSLEFTAGGQTINLQLPEVTLRLWKRADLPAGTDGATLTGLLEAGNLIDTYHRKLQVRAQKLAETETLLHDNRKVGEDFCRYDRIRAEDVAVCADLHLRAGADVELTLARFYRTLELLLNPQVPFRSLPDMEAAGYATEAIFDGPALQQGFILQDDLDASVLRSRVFVSDLINALMDIEGVLAIEALRFTVYDAEGRPVAPAHDWCIPVSAGHYPTLYLAASQVMVYKDGLPLLPRRAELTAVLNQLRAQDRALALPVSRLDYPVPTGTHRTRPGFLPVQRTLPATYGLSLEGLPDNASDRRVAQARQLAAYLIPLEVITASTADQLTYFGDLFSTDEGVSTTYRVPDLFDTGEPLEHLQDLLAGPANARDTLAGLLEREDEFTTRRNRFLDHLLARFGESMQDYTLLIHDQTTRQAYGPEKLIQDKVRFLRFLPEISARRGIGIHYRLEDGVCGYRNRSGLGERIRRLLGMEDVRAYFRLAIEKSPPGWKVAYTLTHPSTDTELLTDVAVGESYPTAQEAQAAAWSAIEWVVERGTDAAHYRTDGGSTFLTGPEGDDLAELPAGVTADDLRTFLADTLLRERLYVVEHLLLRPKFPGDALMDVCLADDCDHRGMEDPYSFRITYLLPADVAPFSEDMDLRRYADRLIRRETPVHLLPKLCWISDAKGESEYTPEELDALLATCRCPVPDELARQLSRFEAAWCPWLTANAAFAWPEINDELEAAVLDWLPQSATLSQGRLLLGYFGERYRAYVSRLVDNDDDLAGPAATWMDEVWPDFTADLDLLRTRDPALTSAWGLPDAARLNALRDLLTGFYTEWFAVSALLHRLLRVFQGLRSAYPVATLHDCDDGDDENPVRLDQTTLGTF